MPTRRELLVTTALGATSLSLGGAAVGATAKGFVKRLHLNGEDVRVEVGGLRPAGGLTVALVAREAGVVAVRGLVHASDPVVRLHVAAEALPAAGGAVGALARAAGVHDGLDGAFVAVAPGRVDARAVLADVAARLDAPGPGDMDAGLTVQLVSGGTMTRPAGAVTGEWQCLPPDSKMGSGVDSSVLGKFRVVVSRSVTTMPGCLPHSVTVSRGAWSQTCYAFWDQPGGGGTYAVGRLAADALQGVSGDVEVEYVRFGTTYTLDGAVISLNPANGSTSVAFDDIGVSSTVGWNGSNELDISEPT